MEGDRFLDNESLIAEVKSNPIIFDRTHQDYSNREMQGMVWQKISDDLGISDVARCRERWKNLRDSYYKAKNKNHCRPYRFSSLMRFLPPPRSRSEARQPPATFARAERHKPEPQGYVLVQNELAKPPHIFAERESMEPAHSPQYETFEIEDSASEETARTKEEPRDTHVEQLPQDVALSPDQDSSGLPSFRPVSLSSAKREPIDGEEMFALSLVPTLRRLTERQKAAAKIQIQQILYNAEFPSYEQPIYQAGRSVPGAYSMTGTNGSG